LTNSKTPLFFRRRQVSLEDDKLFAPQLPFHKEQFKSGCSVDNGAEGSGFRVQRARGASADNGHEKAQEVTKTQALKAA
jgi:hypothetical protein